MTLLAHIVCFLCLISSPLSLKNDFVAVTSLSEDVWSSQPQEGLRSTTKSVDITTEQESSGFEQEFPDEELEKVEGSGGGPFIIPDGEIPKTTRNFDDPLDFFYRKWFVVVIMPSTIILLIACVSKMLYCNITGAYENYPRPTLPHEVAVRSEENGMMEMDEIRQSTPLHDDQSDPIYMEEDDIRCNSPVYSESDSSAASLHVEHHTSDGDFSVDLESLGGSEESENGGFRRSYSFVYTKGTE